MKQKVMLTKVERDMLWCWLNCYEETNDKKFDNAIKRIVIKMQGTQKVCFIKEAEE